MSDNPKSYSDKFEAVRKQYISSLSVRNAELLSAYNDKDIAEIVHVSHKLAGSGASFGFPSISTLGRDVETVCESLSGLGLIQEADWQTIGNLVDLLKMEIEVSINEANSS